MQKLIAADAKLQQKSERKIKQNLPTRFPRSRRKLHGGLTPSVASTLRGIKRAIAEGGGVSYLAMESMADRCGISASQFYRDRDVLVERGRIVCQKRKGIGFLNDTNLWKLPDLASLNQLPFLADVLKPLKALKLKSKNITPLPPTADAAGDGEPSIPETEEPEKPKPSAEVHEALAEARRFRQERNRQRRMRRYEQNRERWVNRRQKPQTPQSEAARHILGLLGIALSMTATREAVERSAGEWMRQKGCGIEAAVNGLLAAWKDYETTCWDWRAEYPCGMLTWFGECRWQKEYTHEWREIEGRRAAATGSSKPSSRFCGNMAALREKTSALLAQFGMQEDYE
jgi:hypothetical protein